MADETAPGREASDVAARLCSPWLDTVLESLTHHMRAGVFWATGEDTAGLSRRDTC